MYCIRLTSLTDYTRELFREAIPYSEINRMAEIVFLPRWQKLFLDYSSSVLANQIARNEVNNVG